jgi:hypothetical protein
MRSGYRTPSAQRLLRMYKKLAPRIPPKPTVTTVSGVLRMISRGPTQSGGNVRARVWLQTFPYAEKKSAVDSAIS